MHSSYEGIYSALSSSPRSRNQPCPAMLSYKHDPSSHRAFTRPVPLKFIISVVKLFVRVFVHIDRIVRVIVSSVVHVPPTQPNIKIANREVSREEAVMSSRHNVWTEREWWYVRHYMHACVCQGRGGRRAPKQASKQASKMRT